MATGRTAYALGMLLVVMGCGGEVSTGTPAPLPADASSSADANAACTAGSCGAGMECCYLRGADNEPGPGGAPPVCVAECNWTVGLIACTSDADCASLPGFRCDGSVCHN